MIGKRKWRTVAAGVAAVTAASSFATVSASALDRAGSAPSVQGITAKTITVGTVADISGPVPGLFQGGIDAVQAYFAYVNSRGGIDGRKVVVDTADSGLSCATTQSAYQSLVNKVFAFVGSWSDFDNCAVSVLKAHPQITSIDYGLTNPYRALSNEFTIRPSPPGFYLGPFKYLHKKYPGVTKVATVYSGTAAGIDNETYQTDALKNVGIKLVYSRSIPTTPPTDFTSDIIRMRSAGAQMLFMDDVDVGTAARVINDAYQQNWHPKLIDCAVCYDQNFKKLVNPAAAEGVYMEGPAALYLGEDRKVVPEVNKFLTWLNKTHPGFPADLFAAYSWGEAALFVHAMQKAGHNPTLASLRSAIKAVNGFTDNEMYAPADQGKGKPPTCWILGRFHNGNWARVTPKKGFNCNPGGYYSPKS